VAANTWNNSQANNNGNDPLNWSLGHVPTTGETATWDATSTDDCNILTAHLPSLEFVVTSAYTGTITIGNARYLAGSPGGASSVDGKIVIDSSSSYLYHSTGSGSLSLGANADISGVGYIFFNANTSGIISNAGASVTCDRISYNLPRTGCSLAAGTYGCDLDIVGHPSLASYSDFEFGAGSHQYDNVKFTSPGTVAFAIAPPTTPPSR
jgi:hypothetical protein